MSPRAGSQPPSPSPRNIRQSCPWSRIPGATQLCRAGTGRIPRRLPAPGHEGVTHGLARPWGRDPEAAGQLTVRHRAGRLHLPAPHLPPASRRCAPGRRCQSGQAGVCARSLSAGSLDHVTSTFSRSQRKWVMGRWGTLTSATPALQKAAATAPRVLCQRLEAALPAGIPADSNATPLRPRG